MISPWQLKFLSIFSLLKPLILQDNTSLNLKILNIYLYSILIVIFSIFTVYSNANMPMIIKEITDSITEKQFDKIFGYFVKYALLIVLVLCSEFVGKLLNAKYRRLLYMKLRNLFVRGILFKGKKGENPQELYSIYNNEIESVVEEYYLTIPHIIFQAVSIIWYMYLLFSLNIIASFVILGTNIISILIPYFFEIDMQRIREKSILGLRRLNTAFYDIVEGIGIIKRYSVEKNINNKMESISSDEQKYAYRYSIKNAVLEISMGAISFISQFLIYYVVISSIISGKETIGAFIAILQLSELLIYPINTISSYLITVFSIKKVKNDLFNTLSDCEFEENEQERVEKIEFENVSFSYNQNKYIIDNFSNVFESGKKYLIRGQNGSGKSTILKLLFGELENYSGNIKINGKNIKNYPDISKNLVYVEQNSFLFNENIVSNITLFKNIEDNLIYDILNKVNLDKKLIENRNENLNELNLSISGGEKQKIIIARALLRNSNFLVFDEAMSNIDKNSISIIEKMILSDESLGFINISHNYSEENLKMYDYVLEFTGEKINIIKNC